ncbi:hypothetical protein GON03_03330 [Nocardioides sp. MAH-18]|uniref:Uncharacterized protein n=1 Tax=Nocardioides agri TaxID=2682843 RepID=A0A6L6XM82_9ACTN|nr:MULTISPECIES: hypothetical protein [unclassified Nocardioides]MBA2953332.1 hypothetical protein [Nocardioides sp. CGMCC 1.13656]MVQ48200.1 hypothetical protein [Nocardioides sp. MAH-18]
MGTRARGKRRLAGLVPVAVLVMGLLASQLPPASYADGGAVIRVQAAKVDWIANAYFQNQGVEGVKLAFYEQTLLQMYRSDPNLSPVDAAKQMNALMKAVDTAAPNGLLGFGAAGDAVVPGLLGIIQKVAVENPYLDVAVDAAKVTFQYFSNQTTITNPDAIQQLTATTDLSAMASGVYTTSWGTLSKVYDEAKDGNPLFRTAQNLLFAARTAPTSATVDELLEHNPNLLILREVQRLTQSNGQIKAQLSDLTALVTANLDAVRQQQAQAQATLAHLAGVQKDILAYVKDISLRQQEQAAAAAKAQAEQQVIAAANSGLFILSSLIGLGDPKGAKVVSAVGTAVIQVATSVSKFAELASKMGGLGNALGSVAGAALTGNIIGAVFALIPVFTGAKDANQQILEAIGQLQKQVADLGKVMTERFDHIDHTLNTVYSEMMTAFANLDWKTDQILGGVTDTQNQLVKLHDQLTNLEGGLWSSLSDGFRRPFWNAVDSALGYRRRTHHDLPPDDYVDASSQYYVWATRHAYDEASSGPAQRDYSPERVAVELASYALDVNANYLALLPTSWGLPALASDRLANAHDWMLGARAYLTLALDYPGLAQHDHALRSEARSLMASGLQLQGFERAISGGLPTAYGNATLNPLFATILQKYDGALALLGQAISDTEKAYAARTAHLDPFGGVDQVLPYASDLSTLGCALDGDGIPVPQRTLPITAGTALRIAPGPVRIMSYAPGAVGRGKLTICRGGLWDDYEDKVVGKREITTAELYATIGSKFNGKPLLSQRVGLRRYTLCSVDTTDPDQVCPDEPDPVALVQANWITSVEPALDADTAVSVADQGLLDQLTAGAKAHLEFHQRAELTAVGNSFTTDAATRDAAAQMTGLVAALRAYVQTGLPVALASDEMLAGMLNGDTRMLDEDAAKRLSSWYYSAAVTSRATGVEPWQSILAAAKDRENAFATALGGDLAAERRAGLKDGSLATATTMQRLSVLVSTVLTPGVQLARPVKAVKVPATHVGGKRTVKVKLANPGLGLLHIKKANVKGSGLTVLRNGCRKVEGHGTCSVLLRFAPVHRGKSKARLTLRTNVGRQPFRVRLVTRAG